MKQGEVCGPDLTEPVDPTWNVATSRSSRNADAACIAFSTPAQEIEMKQFFSSFSLPSFEEESEL
jgi:hypothetical protein